MSLWEQHKQARRLRIVEAARTLIMQGGVDALNMQALAREAEVSVATLYNLCGSKADIVYSLLGESIREWDRQTEGISSTDAVDEFTRVGEATTQFCLDNSSYVVPLLQAVSLTSDPMRDPPIAEQIIGGLRKRIERAAQNGVCIADDIAHRVAARQMYLNVSLVTRLWARGALSADEFRPAYVYAVFSALSAVTTPDFHGSVRSKLSELEPAIADAYPLSFTAS